MANNNDDGGDKGAGPELEFVCIDKPVLGVLFATTGESIDFEDHDEFVVVFSKDLDRLRKLAFELVSRVINTLNKKETRCILGYGHRAPHQTAQRDP